VLKPHGIFLAISTTYLMSSLLHGLNLQLAAVLLSLGLYTYIEYKLRAKFGSIFNACILANKCRATCLHLCKTDNWKVIVTNVAFGLLTVFHLAYLGVMFEASFTLQESGFSLKHALAKWKELDYASHLTIAFYYVFYYLI
jgi:O-palmitoleoyl transferase